MTAAALPAKSKAKRAGSANRANSANGAGSLLIVSSKAGSMTPEVEAKLRTAFATSLIVEFEPKMDLEKLVSPTATIMVAGGDGTIGWVVRRLPHTRHPLRHLSRGTLHNLAE